MVVKDEKLSSLEPISKPSLSERKESSPITEEEVRAVLRAIEPTTCQDLVLGFKARLITQEVGFFSLLITRLFSMHYHTF